MRSLERAALAAFLLGIFPLFGAQAKWEGTITKEGDVAIVKNPKEPLYKDPVLSLKEDFSIGGAGATDGYIFSYLKDIAVDQDGNIYALDLRESCIKVFDRSAKYLRTIGRRGQGPGELGGPFFMTLVSAKNEIYVHDVGGRRVSVFRPDGVFVRQIPIRGMVGEIKADLNGNFFVLETTFDQGVSQDILKKMIPDLSQVLAEIVKHPADESHNPFKPRDRWLLDEEGGLIYGDARSYEIKYFDKAGVFHQIPRLDDSRLAEIFAREVLAFLVGRELLSPEWAERLLSWPHTGFNVHSLVRTKTKPEAERVGKYMIRPVLALERLTFLESEGKVGYRYG